MHLEIYTLHNDEMAIAWATERTNAACRWAEVTLGDTRGRQAFSEIELDTLPPVKLFFV